MEIQFLYFAYFRERFGSSKETLEVPEGATVDQALTRLESKHPELKSLRGSFRVAVGQEMVEESAILKDGDEIALIPPVAGGSPRHCLVLDEPLSIKRVLSAVKDGAEKMGGIASFIGQVRDHNLGHEVTQLEYEAYGDMAIKVMNRLCDEIETEIPGVKLAIEHRVGTLQVGDEAVVIAAAAPHRKEAFQACQALIDRLKDHVPIWKKESSPDGSEWIGMGP